ncbi:MAG: type III pantothenate kinase [Spirochaetaceae bacterium]|nr:MAG: type III pantothenate kinase [Spirochaetaceae bacterium]
MILAINVGNSSTAFGICGDEGWLGRWRIRTVHERMPDEYSLLFERFLHRLNLETSDIDRLVAASVVPQVTEMILQIGSSDFGSEPLLLTAGVETGIRISTDNPAEVGSDLVANAVAAYERYQGSCIIIDFGTALTFTAVDQGGILQGVSIAPGLKYAVRALSQNTAQLPTVQLCRPPAAIGKNTIHSIQSGIIFGYVGMVEALVARIKAELSGTVRVVATGGQADIIAPLTDRIDEVEPWLNLDGLCLISERNPTR